MLARVTKSGLTLREFARREGLDVQRLHSWRRKLMTAAPTFIEVRPREPERVEIVLRSGATVRVSAQIAASDLRRVVDALESSRTPC